MVVTSPPRHLVEWYHAELTGVAVAEMVATLAAACAATGLDGGVRLVVSMAVPSDEVLYVVFAAASTDLVIDVCARAGLPPQRITADVDTRIHLEDVG